MKFEIALLAANEKYESLDLDIDGPIGEELMDSILCNFSLS